ncbi:MAG: hypothetical protein JW981_02535 [Anaerolineae bacterium]|nr:hypothetical protein [Anaerolineae bacterium]
MFKRVVPTAIAVAFGLLVLLGIFLPVEPLVSISNIFIEWAMVLGAFAFIIAFLNLLRVHLDRLQKFRKGSITSLLIVFSAVGTAILVGFYGPENEWVQHIFNNLLVPGQSALLSITVVTLLFSGMQIFRNHRDASGFLFLLAVIIFLLGSVPYIGILHDFAMALQLPATAGMRGVLLGVALGTVLTGLRIIFGVDHPHSDE